MCGLHFAAEGRAAQDELLFAEVNSVGEIRMAVGKLFDAHRAGFVPEMAAKEQLEFGDVKFFAESNSGGMILKIGHAPSYTGALL